MLSIRDLGRDLQSFAFSQCHPAVHVVGPVQPPPPHWPYGVCWAEVVWASATSTARLMSGLIAKDQGPRLPRLQNHRTMNSSGCLQGMWQIIHGMAEHLRLVDIQTPFFITDRKYTYKPRPTAKTRTIALGGKLHAIMMTTNLTNGMSRKLQWRRRRERKVLRNEAMKGTGGAKRNRTQHVGEDHSLLRAECYSQSPRRGNITTPRRVVSRRLPLAERGNFTCLPPSSDLPLNQRPGAGCAD